MTDAHLKKIEAALDAANELVGEILDPTMNWGEVQAFAMRQRRAIRAGIKALAAHKETTP